MKLILVLGILGMLRPTFAATIPVEPRDIINDVQCLVVNLLVATLSLIPSATPYCSSFIHIQTSTITLSRTTTTFPTRTQTRTTGTITITAPKFTSTIYKTATVTGCFSPQKVRREPQLPTDVSGLAAVLQGLSDNSISTACSCLHIPTPSVTVTKTAIITQTITSTQNVAAKKTFTPTVLTTITRTITSTKCNPTPTICGNAGLEIALFENPFPKTGANAGDNYPNFDPARFKSITPISTTVANYIGGFQNSGSLTSPSFYGMTPHNFQFFVLNHRGYVYASVSGTYTFTMGAIDDIAQFWIGPTAYQGYSRSNAVLTGVIHSTAASLTYSKVLAAGTYYPIRVIWANANGPYSFSFTIKNPSGVTIFGMLQSNGNPAKIDVVRRSCGGSAGYAAPSFRSFGQEL